MMDWTPPTRPKEHTEHALLAAILDGTFPPGSSLPGERTLAAQLGVTRPTLREALQRLARDGWLTVTHGKSTVVTNYWQEGGLNVLGALVEHSDHLPPNFVCDLLEVRLHLAPAYTRLAVARHGAEVSEFLAAAADLADTPDVYAAFDWSLHRRLTILSGNPIYTLILNGFAGFYEDLAGRYFQPAAARAVSREYYRDLRPLAENGESEAAADLARDTMARSIALWEQQQGAACGPKEG
jgi:GntR family negative regulator for fad regulon and positive regulator of fabA